MARPSAVFRPMKGGLCVMILHSGSGQTISPTNPLDVSLAGSSAPQAQVMTNQVVLAGATLNAPYEDVSAYTSLSYQGLAEASHTWTLQANAGPTNGVNAGALTNTAGATASKGIDVRARLNFAYLSITNSDVANHTYNVWRRAFVGI